MKKRLLFDDKNGRNDFLKMVVYTKDSANNLIDAFHKHQPFVKINTIEEFQNLCLGPLGAFDMAVLKNLQLPTNRKTDLQINVVKLCELYDIPRPAFMESLGLGDDPVNESCEGCHSTKPKTKGDKSVISYNDFFRYADYLVFDKGSFELNQDRIAKKLESFNHYTDDPDQIAIINLWETLFNSLNEILSKNLGGPATPEKLAQLLPGLRSANNVLYLNEDIVRTQALSFKK